ncbi:MAG: hypothetical protein KDJ90_00395 [Nitratireductor sp.]|nr:hypothetical protein [Nitratireductor sp.]
MGRSVAIVAKGGTSALAPYQDREWEIWGLPWVSYSRVDRLYDVHEQEHWDESPRSSEFEATWYRRSRPLYRDHEVWCPSSRTHRFSNAKVLPVEEIMAFLPIALLENSIAYMIAHALFEHCEMGEEIDRLGIYGVHMRGALEYANERASVLFNLGLAYGIIGEIVQPEGQPLFMSQHIAGRYGCAGGMRMINPAMGSVGALPNIA